MEQNLYVDALLRDPIVAVMVKEALEDGLIDRAGALLAWRLVIRSDGTNGRLAGA